MDLQNWIHNLSNIRRSVKTTSGYDEVPEIASETSADNSFKYQELYSALQRLPDKERYAILLFYLEGYSIKEISGITDASQDAVKQHLSRGRKHLRNLLET